MGEADYFAPGDFNINCSMCGAKMKASEAVKNWQGQWRHPKCNEPRQPQDFVRGVPENMTPPFTQVAGQVFVGVCSPNGMTALPDVGTGDCMLPDYRSPSYDPNAIS